jgi:type II secretion system protein C
MRRIRLSTLVRGLQALLAGLLLVVVLDAVVKPLREGRVFTPRAVSGTPPTSPTRDLQPEALGPVDVQAITAGDLFAEHSVASQDRNSSQGTIVESAKAIKDEALHLILVGVIAGGARSSRAIIEDDERSVTRPYKIGDVVGSATVVSIHPYEVILDRDGQRTTLHMSTAAAGRSSAKPSQRPRPKSAPSSVGSRAAQSTVTRGKMGYVEDIFREAKIEKVVDEGKGTGLRITGLENTPVAELFGLRNGDVVETINGQKVTNKQKAFQVLQKARSQQVMNIELRREGKAKSLSFDL